MAHFVACIIGEDRGVLEYQDVLWLLLRDFMTDSEPNSIAEQVREVLEGVQTCIRDIDVECNTLDNDIELGLANVKFEFCERALQETGKKLTAETILAWLIQKKYLAVGWKVEREFPYPERNGSGRSCDLVFHFSNDRKLWWELKLASKAWFNCNEPPVYKYSGYLTYLTGRGKKHSLRQDFDKLGLGDWPTRDFRVICLIAFDRPEDPIDGAVAMVLKQAQDAGMPWEEFATDAWADRRCDEFRIKVWNWVLLPKEPPEDQDVSTLP